MSTAYLAIAALTGALLLAVGAYVAWISPWRRWAPSATPGAVGGTADGGLGVAAILLGGLAVVALGSGVGVGVAGSTGGIAAVVGLFGGLLALYVTWGAYHICRARGLHYAQAVGVGVWLLGMVFLAGIVAKLLLSG